MMLDAADGFRVPNDPREMMLLLDMLRIRVLAFTESLDITDDEVRMLGADCASLTDAVRATDAAEDLAREWRGFQARLLQDSESAISPPALTVIPPIMGNSRNIGSIVRETRAGGNLPIRAGVARRLQRFVDRLTAHPNMTGQTLFDLGLLPGASIGFSPGQPST